MAASLTQTTKQRNITLKGITITNNGITMSNASITLPAQPLVQQLRPYMAGTGTSIGTGGTRARGRPVGSTNKPKTRSAGTAS